MAKIPDEVPQVTRAAVMKMRQRVVMKPHRGQTVVQKWPKKRGKPKGALQQAWVDRFSLVACFVKSPSTEEYDRARQWADGTGWFWRDVLTAAANGNLLVIPGQTKITTPTFYVGRDVVEPLAAGTAESVNFDGLEWDNNVFWNPISNPNRLTFFAPGLYLVGADGQFNNTATDKRCSLFMRVNGTKDLPRAEGQDIANNDIGLQVASIWYFNAGDYLELRVLSTVACDLNSAHLWGVAITPEGLV